MQGGGFQVYHTPTREGYIIPEIATQLSAVADFVRARQSVSHHSQSIPQIALLLSGESYWEQSDQPYAPWGGEFEPLEGALQALLENHYSVDILAEHQLTPRLHDFPGVVIPDAPQLAPRFREILLQYVNHGGSLLLMGAKSARLFATGLGVEFIGEPEPVSAELASPSGVVNVNGDWQKVTPLAAKILGAYYPNRDYRQTGHVAASWIGLGAGKLGAVYGPLARQYFLSHHPVLRDFIGEIMTPLFPTPAVQIDGPPGIDIALRRTQAGQMSLHFLNRANMPVPDRYNFTDFIPTVGPIQVRWQVPKRPRQVQWVPDGIKLHWTWKDGVLSVTIPSLHIHGVLVVD